VFDLLLHYHQQAKTTVDEERTRLSGVVKDIRSNQIPALKTREVQMLEKIDTVRSAESPIVTSARDEIALVLGPTMPSATLPIVVCACFTCSRSPLAI
jgi:hypothetical protein